jgi:MFS family permease
VASTEDVRAHAEAALPRGPMLVVGGLMLTVSVGAFFRVPLLPMMGDELSMSAGQLGMLTTAFAVGRLLTDIPAGRAADRAEPMLALGLAGVVMAAGSATMGIAPAAMLAYVGAFLLGIGSSMANTTGMTFFSTAAPARLRGQSMAAYSAALLGGQALGPTVGGLIGDRGGWRAALITAAVLGVSVAIIAALGRWSGVLSTAVPVTGPRTDPTPPPPATPRHLPRVSSQTAILYSVAFASFFMLGAMPQTLIPIIGDSRYGLRAGTIGIALGVGAVCRFIGAIAGGRVADRVSRKAALVPGLALSSGGVAILALDLGVAGWATSIVLLSLGSYGVSVSAAMLADRAGGRRVGKRLGNYRFVGDLGLIAGPALSALVYERAGDVAAVLVVATLLAVVTVAAGLFLHETRWLEDGDADASDPSLTAGPTGPS